MTACLKCWLFWLLTGSIGAPKRAFAAPLPHSVVSSAPFRGEPFCAPPFIQLGKDGPSCIVGDGECKPNEEGQRMIERLSEGCKRGLAGPGKPCLAGIVVLPKERRLEAVCTEMVREAGAR